MRILRRFFIGTQTSVNTAAVVLMITVLFSRILGLVRDRLLASYFPPAELGIYFAAFRLPNMIFDLLVTGALTTAFIPIYTKLLTKEGEAKANKMASVVLNYGLIILSLLVVLIVVFATPLSRLLAPGFTEKEIEQMASYTQFMVIFQVVPLMVGNIFTGILQSRQVFFIPALSPILYNVGIIIGLILFSSSLGLAAPVIGVGIGAFLFVVIQVPSLFILKYHHFFTLDKKTAGVKEVAKLMLPRTIGVGVSQIDATVDLVLASLLGSKMITIFQFAQQLQQVPIGLFGATIAQASLPTLSRTWAREDTTQFKKQLISAIHQVLFFVLPISIFFIVFRIPLTRLIFGSSRFDWEATVLTGETLSAFSLSLFAQASIHVLARAFYAIYDTKTPVIVGIGSILLNTILSILFVSYFHFPVWALGLSTSIATSLHALCLFIFLQRKVGRFSFEDIISIPIRIIIASSGMGILCFGLVRLFDQLIFDTTRTINVFLLTSLVGTIGMVTYLFLAWVLDIGQVYSFIRLFHKVKKLRAIFQEETRPIED